MVKKTKVIWAEVITKSAFFDTNDEEVIKGMIFSDETSEIEMIESYTVETIEIFDQQGNTTMKYLAFVVFTFNISVIGYLIYSWSTRNKKQEGGPFGGYFSGRKMRPACG